MAHGRFNNPIIAALAGVKDFLGSQDDKHQLKDTDRADGKTILITGANSGLGFGLSAEFAKRGGNVIMACRRQIPDAGEKIKELTGSETVSMRYLDLSKIESIHAFCEALKEEHITLDIIVLNAGVALPESRKTDSGLEEMFLVNYLSNVVLTSCLLKNGIIPNHSIAKNKRNSTSQILFISSDSHQGSSFIDYQQFGKFESYGITKGMNYYSYYKLIANTYFTELSRRLNKTTLDVAVNVMCPGPVHSNIIKEAPWVLRKILGGIFFLVFKSPAKAAQPILYMTLSEEFRGKTNEYFHMFNSKRMDEKVYLEEEGIKLWDQTFEVLAKHDPKMPEYDVLGID